MRSVWAVILLLSGSLSGAGEPLPAFPGAEGHGRFTVGGRGGGVYEVTNLEDSGPGSLRAAVNARGPRTVVFRVSGTIALESPLKVREPYLTIAGQTAPGGGIALRNHPLSIDADEVIVRHLRVRLGDQSGRDADAISSRFTKQLILDHVSASWSIDECVSIYHTENLTVQWCLVAESLYESKHHKGSHGFGGIWGSNYSTFHHNLIASHTSRNPRMAGGAQNVDFRNNVVYNWGYNSIYGGEPTEKYWPRFDFTNINLVANYFKPGPATRDGVRGRIANPSFRDGGFGRWHVAENHVVGAPEVTADNRLGVHVRRGDGVAADALVDEPWPADPITQQTPQRAFELVLEQAGATLPERDAVDARIVGDTRRGTATYEGPAYRRDIGFSEDHPVTGIVDSPEDVGGWPELESTPAPADSDHDGMPDAWEVSKGLDPHDAEDRNRRAESGYTMLEEYLNGIE